MCLWWNVCVSAKTKETDMDSRLYWRNYSQKDCLFQKLRPNQALWNKVFSCKIFCKSNLIENPLKRQFFHKNILTVSLCHFSVVVDENSINMKFFYLNLWAIK